MRFMIMHRTNAHWESGAIPGPDLIARVGALLGDLQKAGVLLAADGLRASSQGARIRMSAGRRTDVPGPFGSGHELPGGFSIVRATTLDEAMEWAARQAERLGDCELDVRPVTEPWDIGMGSKPAEVTTRRYLILRKATPESEAGQPPSHEQRASLSRFIDEATAAGAHIVTETMRPSARGRRYTNSQDGVSYVDGPFTESKELIGGFVIVSASSLEDADRWTQQYVQVVGAQEVDVRELE